MENIISIYPSLPVPNELEDLIVEFMYYPVKKLRHLDVLATSCWLTSKSLPTPDRWKRCLTDTGRFDWGEFLNSAMRPNDAETLIDLAEVRHTIQLLNWHHIKILHTTAASWALYMQKKIVLRHLKEWSPRAHTLIYLIQRLLCALEYPKSLNKVDPFEIDCCCIRNPNPLCMYLRSPQHYI